MRTRFERILGMSVVLVAAWCAVRATVGVMVMEGHAEKVKQPYVRLLLRPDPLCEVEVRVERGEGEDRQTWFQRADQWKTDLQSAFKQGGTR